MNKTNLAGLLIGIGGLVLICTQNWKVGLGVFLVIWSNNIDFKNKFRRKL